MCISDLRSDWHAEKNKNLLILSQQFITFEQLNGSINDLRWPLNKATANLPVLALALWSVLEKYFSVNY